MILAAADSSVFATGIKVAMVKCSNSVDVYKTFDELDVNWVKYGSTPLTIDKSLIDSDFTYESLLNTDADVLWLCNPAGASIGGNRRYTPAEVAAIEQYASEGHSILGTYKVFQAADADNRGLAPIFGLRQDINYNTSIVPTNNQTFNILDTGHPLFEGIDNPYDSNGYSNAQVPADDFKWDTDTGDFGSAVLLAKTDNKRGVITWYETDSYHAIFISEMPEQGGFLPGAEYQPDMQFLYNALTIPEPATIALLTLGGLVLFKRKST